jgi:methionine-rich copper-binding protein CopC
MGENSYGEMTEMRAPMLDKTPRQAIGLAMLSAALLLSVTQAQAHANLVSSDPAKDAAIAAPKLITLHFSEALEMKVSGFRLTDLDGNPVAIKAVAAPDKKSLAAAPAAPLAPGLYTISWTSMGDDSHKMNGTLSFTVK